MPDVDLTPAPSLLLISVGRGEGAAAELLGGVRQIP